MIPLIQTTVGFCFGVAGGAGLFLASSYIVQGWTDRCGRLAIVSVVALVFAYAFYTIIEKVSHE